MKLKMAENSLFAMLLRKPWWVSLLVVAGLSLLSGALLPAPYVPFGVMGSFPFMVIAVMAAWRQRNKPNPARVAQLLDEAARLSWPDFSQRLAQGFARQGYAVQTLKGPGADFLLTMSGRTTVVSCRRWKAANQGVDALRDLLAAQSAQGAQQSLYISLVALSDAARTLARTQGIRLMSTDELAQVM